MSGLPQINDEELDELIVEMGLDGSQLAQIADHRSVFATTIAKLNENDPVGTLGHLAAMRATVSAIDIITRRAPHGLGSALRTVLLRDVDVYERRMREAAEGASRVDRAQRIEKLCRGQASAVAAEVAAAAVPAVLPPTSEWRPPSCFISYAWPSAVNGRRESWVQPFLGRLRDHLRAAGVRAQIDTRDLGPGANPVIYMRDGCQQSTIVFVVCTESLFDKSSGSSWCGVQNELAIIGERIEQELQRERPADQPAATAVYPVLLSGSPATAIPLTLQRLSMIDAAEHDGDYTGFVGRLAGICYGRTMNTLRAAMAP